jgi:hypothetical protein
MLSLDSIGSVFAPAGVALSLLLCAGAAQATTFQTIATRGQQAPGLAGGVTLTLGSGADAVTSGAPAGLELDSAPGGLGTAFFTGLGSGPGGPILTVANDSAWYLERPEGASFGLVLAAREGDQVPGAPAGTNFSTLGNWAASGSSVALVALQNGPAVLLNAEAVYGGTAGTSGVALTTVAQKSLPAPGVTSPGVTFTDFTDASLVVAPGGAVAFHATLFGPGISAANNAGIWVYEPGAPGGGFAGTLVARLGGQAPGFPAGAALSNFVDPSLATNTFSLTTGARVLFHAGVSGGGTTFLNNSGLFFGSASTLWPVARKGDEAPGYPGRTMLSIAGSACAGDNVIWRAMISGIGPAGNVLYRGAVNPVAGGPGPAVKIIAKDDPAPGVPGASFNDVLVGPFVRPRLNSAGQGVIPGTLITGGAINGGNNEALWFMDAQGQLELIAREGDALPGSTDTVYGSGTLNLRALAINEAGTVAFRHGVIGPEITGGNDEVLALWSPGRGTRVLARWGQAVTLEDGVTRTISSFDTQLNAGAADGRATGLRADGSVVFKATLSDGTARLLVAREGPVACGASDIASPWPAPGPDGELTADDVIQFIALFVAGDARADVAGPGQQPGPDGELTADDVIVFIGAFVAGC